MPWERIAMRFAPPRRGAHAVDQRAAPDEEVVVHRCYSLSQ
jgi:hypothetical protein